MTDTARHRASGPAGDDPRTAGEDVVVVRSEERLRTAVVRLPAERVRVHRDVVVEQVTHTFEVRREVLRIEREPVQRGSGAVPQVGLETGGAPGAPRVLEVVLREERPVLGLEVVPVERVRIAVVATEEVVHVEDEVRVERVEIDTTGTATGP